MRITTGLVGEMELLAGGNNNYNTNGNILYSTGYTNTNTYNTGYKNTGTNTQKAWSASRNRLRPRFE